MLATALCRLRLPQLASKNRHVMSASILVTETYSSDAADHIDPAYFVCDTLGGAEKSTAFQKLQTLERWSSGRNVRVMDRQALTPSSWASARPSDTAFDLPTFFQHLQTRRDGGFGRTLLYSRCLPSTQTLLTGPLSGSERGFVCVADVQSAGKGRGSNTWESPVGCLMFSFANQYADGRSLPFVQYLVSLAMLRAVGSVPGLSGSTALADGGEGGGADSSNVVDVGTGSGTGTCAGPAGGGGRSGSRPQLRLKWPNDLYIEIPSSAPSPTSGAADIHGAAELPSMRTRLKVGGVLCQSSKVSGELSFEVVSGVGINVNNSEPTVCLNSALTMDVDGSKPSVTRAELLARFFNQLEELDDIFMGGAGSAPSFSPLLDEYLLGWMHAGQQVTATVGDSQQALTILGLAGTGALLAEDDTGAQHELYPDGNSLDMMTGMISQKKRR